jgi:hypothetical protein
MHHPTAVCFRSRLSSVLAALLLAVTACSGRGPATAGTQDGSASVLDGRAPEGPTPALPDARPADGTAIADGASSDASPADEGAGTTADAANDQAGPSDGASDQAPPASSACALPAGAPFRGKDLAGEVQAGYALAFNTSGGLMTSPIRQVSPGIQARPLLAIPYLGTPMTVLPDVGTRVRAMRFLPGGDLLVSTLASGGDSVLIQVTPRWTRTTTLTMPAQPRAIVVDQQGKIYVSALSEVRRVDLATGQSAVVARTDSGDFVGLAFSPDYRTLYAARLSGEISKLAVAPDGKLGPLQPFFLFPDNPSSGQRGGALATDECNNVFMLFERQSIWRITPAGDSTQVTQERSFISSFKFGNGRGGWKDTALYLMFDPPQGNLIEVDLGVRGMKDPHE